MTRLCSGNTKSACLLKTAAGRGEDDVVFEDEESWLEDLERSLARVMIHKRRAKLGWGSNDDKHVTIPEQADCHEAAGPATCRTS